MALKPKIVDDYPDKPKKLSNLTAIIDLDFIKYSSASVGEVRTIEVTLKETGKTREFESLSEFCGRRNNISGWLGDLNDKRISKGKAPYSISDFDVKIIQHPEPIAKSLHTAKMSIARILDALGTDKVKMFIGEGASWRVESSTLLEYKGQRVEATRAVNLGEVTDYLKGRFLPKVVRDLECDDMVLIEHLRTPDSVIVAVDKDTYGCPCLLYNPNRPQEGIVDCRGFGSLWMEGTKVKGKGRLFLYFQTISGDKIDNYKFNCMSSKKWGDKSAFTALVDCKDDKEALTKMIEVAKLLYPEKKTVVGWRGDEIEIDWLYVLDECFRMARMREYEDDTRTIIDWFNKYEVTY